MAVQDLNQYTKDTDKYLEDGGMRQRHAQIDKQL